MKKKIVYGSLLAIVFALSLVFKTKHDENMQQALFGIGAGIGAGIDIEIGTQNCVCKGITCSEANWISFRKACGDSSGWGGNTDWACSKADRGNCN